MEAQVTLSTGRVPGYALGLEIDALSGERTVAHGGWTAGYKSYVGRVPSRGTAVALLCNAGSLNTEEVGAALLAIAAELPMGSYYEEPQLGAPADTLDATSLARLAGSYRSARTRQAVRVRGYAEGITVNSWTGYKRTTDSTFAALTGDRTITFQFDAAKRARGYVIRQGSDVVTYTRVDAWQPSTTERESLVGRYRCDEADAVVEIVHRDNELAFQRRGRLHDRLVPRYRDAFMIDSQGWLLTVRRSGRGRVIGIDLGGSRSRTVPCARVN